MNRRLEQFLAAENISQSQFADTIGVARASVSHILAGRNKPGFDFIESMSRHFPSLNIEWLILGTGKMYKSAGANTQENAPAMLQEPDSVNLFDSQEIEENEPADLFSPAPASLPESPAPKFRPISTNTIDNKSQTIKRQRNITKIIVFYDDNTYQELK